MVVRLNHVELIDAIMERLINRQQTIKRQQYMGNDELEFKVLLLMRNRVTGYGPSRLRELYI